MGFGRFSPIVLDIQICASFDPILVRPEIGELGMVHSITTLKNWSQKWIANLKKNIVIKLEIWNIVYKYDPLEAHFNFMTSQGLLNLQILENWWKIKFFISRIMHGSKFRYFYCFLVAICSFGNIFEEFGNVMPKSCPVLHLPSNIL